MTAASDDLRVRTARGTVLNAGFTIGLQGLSLLKGFVVAAFLTTSDYGVWGILVITLGTLSWLKQVGISEKFVQQDDPDEERAFRRAFTLDLLSNLALLVIALVLLPIFAVLYGEWEIVAPGLVLLATVPFQSLLAPTWIFYRHMRFGRQRLLTAVDPVVSFLATLGLAIAGLGYWSLVAGFAAGVVVAGIVAVAASPYRLALDYDRATMREYLAFSWPLFVMSASALVIPQASMLVGEAQLGLAGAGVIALASTISTYTDKVDEIVTWTLYPAICRIKDRTELLFEAFVKSNRLTLMWGVPFGAGVAVFAGDIVTYGLGEKWEPAVGLIRAFAITSALNHLAYNWAAFFRARGDTKPLAVAAPAVLIGFFAFALPGLILFDLEGFGIGIGLMTGVSLAVRGFYLRRLFPGFRLLRHAARAVAPTLPAVGVALAIKALDGENTAALFALELLAYVAVTIAATLLLEGRLLREALGYARGRRPGAAPSAQRSATASQRVRGRRASDP